MKNIQKSFEASITKLTRCWRSENLSESENEKSFGKNPQFPQRRRNQRCGLPSSLKRIFQKMGGLFDDTSSSSITKPTRWCDDVYGRRRRRRRDWKNLVNINFLEDVASSSSLANLSRKRREKVSFSPTTRPMTRPSIENSTRRSTLMQRWV